MLVTVLPVCMFLAVRVAIQHRLRLVAARSCHGVARCIQPYLIPAPHAYVGFRQVCMPILHKSLYVHVQTLHQKTFKLSKLANLPPMRMTGPGHATLHTYISCSATSRCHARGHIRSVLSHPGSVFTGPQTRAIGHFTASHLPSRRSRGAQSA